MARTWLDTLRTFKLILRLLGAVVSGLFLVQAVWVFLHPDLEDFWEFCHWLGQGLLGFIVGGAGCYLELRGSMRHVASHFRRFCLNRIGLTIFYFWMGCYVMGGKGVVASGTGWHTVAHITGIVAWVVALGDLMVACTSEGGDEEHEELQNPDKAERAAGRPPGADVVGATAYEDPSDNPFGGQSPEQSFGSHGVTMGGYPTGLPPPPAASSGTSSQGSCSTKGKKGKKAKPGRGMASFADDTADPGDVRPSFDEPVVTDELPQGGWATGGDKPFGCS